MKYFAQCKNLEELKKEFRRLAMIHHPDRGGDVETMKEINNEYDMMFPVLKAATAAPRPRAKHRHRQKLTRISPRQPRRSSQRFA